MGLVSELRRRNVFRMAALYVVAAWLVMQVAEVVIGLANLSDWLGPAILVLLAIGFPIALVFSWLFEVTPEGLSLEKDVPEGQSITHVTGRRMDFVIIAILAAAIVLFAYDKWWPDEAPEQSVAVLPFANVNGDEDSTYFSDGLADTLLHMLAQVPDLRVPARTSSFKFRDYQGDIREVGNQLHVSTILEGSVQIYGDKIRVTAQLIDVESGYHLWSKNFDRKISDVFAIHDEIASEVVSALRLTLLDETEERLDLESTDNISAYDEYLLAISNVNPGTIESYQRAITHLQKAIGLDPDYALAHSTLGRVYLDMRLYGAIESAEALADAKDAASRAIAIAPESSASLAVLGEAELYSGNAETARLLLEKAIEYGPNDVDALYSYGLWLVFQQRDAEAENVFRRVLMLDPFRDDAHRRLSGVLLAQRRTREALEHIARWKEAIPTSGNAVTAEAMCYSVQGKYASALLAASSLRRLDPADPDKYIIPALIYLLMDMPDEARKQFDSAIEINSEYSVSRAAPLWLNLHQRQNEEESVRLARDLLADRIQDRWASGRTVAIFILVEDAAKSGQYAALLDLLDNLYPNLFDDPPYDVEKNLNGTFWVGLVLVQSGDIDRGRYLLRRFVEETDRLDEGAGPVYMPAAGWLSVAARLALGDREAAMIKFKDLAQVERWSNVTSSIVSQNMLNHSSVFDPIRGEPEFIELLDNYRRNAAEQRRLLREMRIN